MWRLAYNRTIPLYRGANGTVARCIIDVRPLKEAGIEVDDIAKRLMDYASADYVLRWQAR